MLLHDTIECVISGGQTGVDVAGLHVAKLFGLPTGGTMPKGWRTIDGPRPEYRDLYNMTEHPSASYGPRTDANARASDVTLQIAADFQSPGERRTRIAIERAGCLWAVVRLRRGDLAASRSDEQETIDTLRGGAEHAGCPLVLNVAGNSERTVPGIGLAAARVLWRIFSAFCAPGRCACGHPIECHDDRLRACSLTAAGKCKCARWDLAEVAPRRPA